MKNFLTGYLKYILVGTLSMVFLPPVIRDTLRLTDIVVMVLGSVLTALSLTYGIYLLRREKRAAQLLATAADKDIIWDPEALQLQVRMMFYKVRAALENKDLSGLKDYTTAVFLNSFQETVDKVRTDISPEMTEARIVCCQDLKDNDEDKFVGYISGVMTDVLKTEFSEMYYFVRQNNYWLLDRIDHRPGIFTLLFAVNREEG